MLVIKVKRMTGDASRLLDPGATEWEAVPEERLTLEPTPLTSQPSLYVQNKWAERPYGAVSSLRVRAGHAGGRVLFRLSWQDASKDDSIGDTDRFTDAAAVLLPVKDDAPLLSMGSPDQPVNAWYWRADLERPWSVTAQGIGTAVRNDDAALASAAAHEGGAWNVVISRGMAAESAGAASVAAGQRSKVAFAVWQGSDAERAGLKAVTLEWQDLEIEG
jgi:DMSO reductase family type II enzyme heme b subunit